MDKEAKRKVPKEKGMELATQYRCKFFEVSSLTGQNVRKAFSYILNEAVKLVVLESFGILKFLSVLNINVSNILEVRGLKVFFFLRHFKNT